MMNAKMLLASITVIGVLFCRAATDEQIKHSLFISNCYVDDADAASDEFRYARQLCGADSNRFARLICEVAHTNHTRVARGMIRSLGRYGTLAQLPFLYSQTTNANHGVWAVKAILAIEGVTSNSVAIVDSYLSMTNMPMPSREDLCLALLDRRGGLTHAMSNLVEECSYRFFSADQVYDGWYDGLVCARLADYRLSKRRLRVLRSVFELGLNKYNEMFVTNAINELVAYPEADLPD